MENQLKTQDQNFKSNELFAIFKIIVTEQKHIFSLE